MKIKSAALLTSFAVLAGGVAHASEAKRVNAPLLLAQSTPDEPIYGAQMMTEQERNEHRAALRAARSDQEREQIRRTHHEQMQSRAKERGVTLPDEPPPRGAGRGMGPGPGAGPGMGPGSGPGR